MNEITTVGLDLAKNVFQVHGVDGEGTTVLRKHFGGHSGPAVASTGRTHDCKRPLCGTPN
jgi:hypothetical protein